jgi:Zn-dependent peptidase ImmA (M78 family)/transcriptional regulator with XRE-family HTH domain
MPSSNYLGERLRRLRLASGLGQQELAERANIAAGTVSMVERGRATIDEGALQALAQVLDVAPGYFTRTAGEPRSTHPQLRAYADASQKTVDRISSDSEIAVQAIQDAQLKLVSDTLPLYDGDLNDTAEIERFAEDVRSTAHLSEDQVIGNTIRTAERLGCVVLPMDSELGRHLGMSLRIDNVPVIRVSRSSVDPEDAVPGDRQRFTVAHELGHLALHAGLGAPLSPAEASQRENEAHRFASSFLAPGDAITQDLDELGGRVTLSALTRLKEKWGFSIKAFVVRFRQLGIIDDDHARSLYKQISARRWNKQEPVVVGNEAAVWFAKAMTQATGNSEELAISSISAWSGLGTSHLHRWLDWSPRGGAPTGGATISTLEARQRRASVPSIRGAAHSNISYLPFSRSST